MDTATILILIPLISVLTTGLIFYFSYQGRISKFKLAYEYAENTKQILSNELKEEKELNHQMNNELRSTENRLTQIYTELKSTRERLAEEQNNEEKQRRRFENIASKIIREQTTSINEQQTHNLNQVLNPLKQKIQQFESRVEATNKEAIARSSSLLRREIPIIWPMPSRAIIKSKEIGVN